MSKAIPILLNFITWITLPFLITSCLGGLSIQESHYFSIASQDGINKNYYRMGVKVRSVLSKVEYNSGWYPKESIDQLFGEVSSSNNTNYIQTQRKLKELNNEFIFQTEKKYLEEASKPNPENLNELFEARKRIQAYPSLESLAQPYGEKSIAFEYNPALGRVINHIDEKQIFMLSSNPDDIINEINNYTEANETAIKLQEIAKAIDEKNKQDLEFEKSNLQFNQYFNSILSTQIDTLVNSLNDSTKASKEHTQAILKSLISTLKSRK